MYLVVLTVTRSSEEFLSKGVSADEARVRSYAAVPLQRSMTDCSSLMPLRHAPTPHQQRAGLERGGCLPACSQMGTPTQ